MRLILIRHGETEENIKGIIQGQIQGTLSAKGIDQAEKLALRLKDRPIDHIYSSDLKRAADTAKILSRYHPEADLILTELIREKHFGKWQGRSKEEFGYPKNESVAGRKMEGAETFVSLFDRARRFIEKIKKEHPDGTVAVVGHSGINKALVCVLSGQKPEDIPSVETINNTGVCIFIEDGKGFKPLVFNDTSHL